MLSKLVFLTVIALIAACALGSTMNENFVAVHTDDTEKLSQMNISSVIQALDTPESRNMSHDGKGLSLGGIHFHHAFDSNTTSSTLSNFTHMDVTAQKLKVAKCEDPRCDYLTPLKWANGYQSRWVSTLVCNFIVQNAKLTVELSSLGFTFKNALCRGGIPCDLIGGVFLNTGTGPKATLRAFTSKCDIALARVVTHCEPYGGTIDCTVSGQTGSFWYHQGMQDVTEFTCPSTGMTCGSIHCNRKNGFCDAIRF